MTSFSNLFSIYTTCSGQQKIKVADGFSPIVGKGTVQISPSLVLKFVLHVPNLTYNLLSIGKLTQDLQCLTIFTSSGCIFQDHVMGKVIGLSKLKDGLYY